MNRETLCQPRTPLDKLGALSLSKWLGSVLLLTMLLLMVPVHAETAHKIIGQRRFNVSYQVKDDLSGLGSVELHYTTDGGQTWRLWGRDEDRTPPIVFEAPEDGQYGFVIVSTDNAGNREAPPIAGTVPEAVAIVDTAAPLVRIDSPIGGEMFGPGANLQLRWVASDANFSGKCVNVMLSSDNGNTWSTVAQQLPNTGSTSIPLPGAAAERYLVKVVVRDLAGNVGQAVIPTPVVVDGHAPRAKLTGPRVSPANSFNVTYEAADIGGSGLAEVNLWYTSDGGLSWTLYGRDADLTSPIEFHVERGGSYGFFLQVKDRVGNSTVAPRPGTRPALVTMIDNRGPEVQLLTLNGGAFRGGAIQEIRWSATDDAMADRPITIDYTIDGGAAWFPIARGEPNDGNYTWTLPQANTNRGLVRVTAMDALGNTAAATSKVPFIIDSVAPNSTATFDIGPSIPPAVSWGITAPVRARTPVTPPATTPPATPAIEPPAPTAVAPAASAASPVDAQLDKVDRWLSTGDARKLDETLGILDKILLKDPQNGRAYALRGRYHTAKKQYQEAREDLERAINLRSQDGSIYLSLGKVHFHKAGELMSREDKTSAADEAALAVACLEEALARPPETHDEFLWSGLTLVRLGRLRRGPTTGYDHYATAIRRLTLAVEKGRGAHDVGVAYYWRATARELAGDLTKAAKDYEDAATSLGLETRHGKKAAEKAEALRRGRSSSSRRSPR